MIPVLSSGDLPSWSLDHCIEKRGVDEMLDSLAIALNVSQAAPSATVVNHWLNDSQEKEGSFLVTAQARAFSDTAKRDLRVTQLVRDIEEIGACVTASVSMVDSGLQELAGAMMPRRSLPAPRRSVERLAAAASCDSTSHARTALCVAWLAWVNAARERHHRLVSKSLAQLPRRRLVHLGGAEFQVSCSQSLLSIAWLVWVNATLERRHILFRCSATATFTIDRLTFADKCQCFKAWSAAAARAKACHATNSLQRGRHTCTLALQLRTWSAWLRVIVARWKRKAQRGVERKAILWRAWRTWLQLCATRQRKRALVRRARRQGDVASSDEQPIVSSPGAGLSPPEDSRPAVCAVAGVRTDRVEPLTRAAFASTPLSSSAIGHSCLGGHLAEDIPASAPAVHVRAVASAAGISPALPGSSSGRPPPLPAEFARILAEADVATSSYGSRRDALTVSLRHAEESLCHKDPHLASLVSRLGATLLSELDAAVASLDGAYRALANLQSPAGSEPASSERSCPQEGRQPSFLSSATLPPRPAGARDSSRRRRPRFSSESSMN